MTRTFKYIKIRICVLHAERFMIIKTFGLDLLLVILTYIVNYLMCSISLIMNLFVLLFMHDVN